MHRLAQEFIWDSLRQLVVAFCQLERVVVSSDISVYMHAITVHLLQAVELPLKASLHMWYPPLSLSERVFFWNLWRSEKMSLWRL